MALGKSKSELAANRDAVIGTAMLIAVIAFLDWLMLRNATIGFLYFLPLVFSATALAPQELLAFSLICAILKEQFSADAWTVAALPRFTLSVIAFLGAAFFVRQTERLRREAMVNEMITADQIRRRIAAEQQLQSFVEGSPAAIVTTDSDGRIVLANEAAHEMLGFDSQSLPGRLIEDYLPTVGTLRQTTARMVRTSIECTGYRKGGEAFSAQVWVSSFGPPESGGLGLVVFDSSEQLRTREEGRLQSLTASARVILGSFWHETRNFCTALRVTAASLKHIPAVAESEEISAINSLIEGLEKLAVSELRPEAKEDNPDCASVRVTLDHLRVVVEPWFRECGATVSWKIANDIPLVRGDEHALLQVFLNIARNAARVLRDAPRRTFTVEAMAQGQTILVHFRNSGPPPQNPETLFQPFRPEAEGRGIGLYVSRAILRSLGGEIKYGLVSNETTFTVSLQRATWFLRAYSSA
jgi:PAS domain S-box-containing protein